jgi:hypothetical protein
MAVAPTAMRHRFTQGTLAKGEPIYAMLAGQTADLLYSSPPWDDAHVKMYDRRLDWNTFFTAFVGIVRDHVSGWVFIEHGIAMADKAAQMLSQVCADVTIHSTSYGPAKSKLPSRLLVGHTDKPVRGQWHIPNGCYDGGARQPLGILRSVAMPGQVLLDPCCTNIYGAQAARKLGLVFLGNDHLTSRGSNIKRVLES